MVITIMGGLLVATILTLVVVPALYALWFRVRADEPLHNAEARPFEGATIPFPIAEEPAFAIIREGEGSPPDREPTGAKSDSRGGAQSVAA
jgi:hypothetical protein